MPVTGSLEELSESEYALDSRLLLIDVADPRRGKASMDEKDPDCLCSTFRFDEVGVPGVEESVSL